MRKTALLLSVMLLSAALSAGGSREHIPFSPADPRFVSDTTERSASISSTLYSLGNLYAYINEYCLYPIDGKEMEEKLVAAMLDSIGDPYSYYIPSENAEDYSDNNAGSYVGIGIYLSKMSPSEADLNDPGSWMVIISSVFPSSPAERAGLRARDMISHINGESVASLTASEASKALRGKSGEDVTLTVHRGSAEFEITLRPERIIAPTADSTMLTDEIGYLAIYSFTMTTADSVEKELASLMESNPKAIIIDLRNNPGGAVDASLEIADMFLPQGVMLTTKFSDHSGRPDITDRATSPVAVPADVDIAILINGGTASSSEILTAALSENDRAITVGSTSFGKGISQEVRPFSEGYIQVTTGHFFTPDGNDIHEKGIEPDYIVEEEEYSDEEMEAYEEFMKENPFSSYIEEYPEYSAENIDRFAQMHSDSGVPQSLLKMLIRNEYLFQLDYDMRPIADPDYDETLRKAMEILSV